MTFRGFCRLTLAATLIAIATPQLTWAHFVWLLVERGERPGEAVLRAAFNELPEPHPNFLKYVSDLKITVDGREVPSAMAEESRDARWAGRTPVMVDAERDLGVMTKGDATYRLLYTARAQTETVAADAKESAKALRVRLIRTDDGPRVEVLFDGKPVAKARIHIYPEKGETIETTTDDQGRAAIDGLAAGKSALWANWVDRTPGELGGKSFAETRHYATFTFAPAPSDAKPEEEATTFATMPDPAVNSFGGAVLGDWLYVYSGHVGKTHHYDVNTTAKSFRRLNLKDRKTWENLPMGRDVQGVALVSDGTYVYRIGGMLAKNAEGAPHDLHSVTDFARFDPKTKTWADLAPLPVGRSTHDAVILGRTIYAVGGWTMKGESEDSEFLEDAVAFDLDKPEAGWRSIAQPFRRRALSAGVANGKLYVLGGLTDGTSVEARVDIYDPASGTWSTGPELPSGSRHEGFGTSAFGLDDGLYFSGASGKIFRLDAEGKAWQLVGAWAHPRITHRILPGPDGSLLAVGGNSKGRQTPVIESIARPSRPAAAIGGE